MEVDLNAILANARAMRWHLGGAALIAVVKEDAYGHGGPQVARALESEAEAFGVANVQQAAALRAAGVRVSILMLSPMTPAGAIEARRLGLTPTVAGETDLATAPPPRGGFLNVHVKFDTGMGRLGFHHSRARAVALLLRKRGVRRVAGVYTHLAASSEKAFTGAQVTRFEACRQALNAGGIVADLAHVSNSEGVVTSPRACATGVVRPGLMLYGCAPAATRVPFPLQAALSFKTRIAAIREVPARTTVSYGHTYTTRRFTKLAVLPVGYSGGLSRHLSNRGAVLVRGVRVPIRGRVCMNLTVVDVTNVKGCRVGDEVVLIGQQGRERISADELAGLQRTISYEVLCVAGGLNPRVYREERRAG